MKCVTASKGALAPACQQKEFLSARSVICRGGEMTVLARTARSISACARKGVALSAASRTTSASVDA